MAVGHHIYLGAGSRQFLQAELMLTLCSLQIISAVMQHRELAQVFVSGVQMLRYVIHSMLGCCT